MQNFPGFKMVSENSVLLVKHLPPELSAEDREELLKLVGAESVRVMPDYGKMKFCAFASFKNHKDAKYALSILHQREILSKKLIVEYASDQDSKFVPHLSDAPKKMLVASKENSASLSEREILKVDLDDFSKKLHGVSPALGLDYIPSPLLKYKYPAPTPSIIQNISHVLISVPKFYTQVLHLMNKMNLPAPFGPLTPAPPITPDPCLKVDKSTEVCSTDILGLEKMDLTSEESESEYESEPETGEKKEIERVLPVKRPTKKRKLKREVPKVSKMLRLSTTLSNAPKPRTEPSEVFDSLPMTQKKINVKKIDHIAPTEPPVTNTEPTGGFGAFEAAKEPKDSDLSKEPVDELWDDSLFISLDELRARRIPSDELKTISIFRNYSPGEPTIHLYIKNLARQVKLKDLRYIFGRFIGRNSENDKNMFNVQLMDKGRMKGQAFVTLASEDQAKAAVKETNGFVLHTKPMFVQFARSAKPKEDDKKAKK